MFSLSFILPSFHLSISSFPSSRLSVTGWLFPLIFLDPGLHFYYFMPTMDHGPQPPALLAQELTFAYPESLRPALEEVSFALPAGQFTAMLGGNGSGKSTLARILAGLQGPYQGRLEVLGRDLADPASPAALRGRVGLAFQSPDTQMVATTAEREIAFGPENLGLPPPDIRARVDELLARFGLKPYARRSPHLLSGGEKQRLALASVLAMRPEILILDEVTSLLDPLGRREVMEMISGLRGSVTLILITQFSAEALAADRALLFDRGRLVEDEAPEALFRRARGREIHGVEVPLAFRLLRAAQGSLPQE
ncbi:MAG: ATP-binding cassette domain-containing protein [Candidatus Zixiibacteriota bacterium]|nr:MAG: ATP-binding cassette domain-containing protein [candidate division Zixibacteria bacterium]